MGTKKRRQYPYDALNRLVAKCLDSANGALLAEYLFDAAGQKGLLSRSKAYSAEGVVEIYNVTYDARNRLTQQNWIVPGTGGGMFRLDHAYNAADQPTTLRYPGGTAGEQGELVATGYNALGQMNSVSGSGVSYVSSTTYNARGQVTEQRLDTGSNGLTRQYIYDENTMRLTTLRAGVASPYTNLQNLSYTYDAVGNIASLVDGVNSSQRQCFQYDALDRLTHAFTGNSDCTAYSATGNYPYNHTYVYDAIGNITSYAGNTYSYDAGKPHAVSAAYGNSYGYDGNGNQTSRTIAGTTYSFVFDYENRLTEVKQGSTTLATFLYDANGNRVKGTVDGVTTVYIAGIYERQGAAASSYYEGGGLRRSGYSTNNGVFYMLGDHLKSTSALVARNGVLNVKYFYYPYGARRGMPFNTITAKHFTGQYHETALPGGEGLSFYNARWYDPKLGSFLNADSIVPNPGDPQSFNRYAYAGGNPLRFSDPSGHMKLCGAACEDGYKWSAPVTKKGLGAGTSNGAIASGSVGGLTGATGWTGGGMRGTLGRILSRPQLSMVKYSSQIYGVPWQITAGLLESEILLDTELKDVGEDIVMGLLPFLTYTRPNGAGPGIGNVHVLTAKSVARYFAANYSGAFEMKLSWHVSPDWQTAMMLVRNDYNIQTVAAFVRQLADYRFGSGGQPLQTDHSDLAKWTLSDAVAIWHGYRYGVPGVSPGGQGWRNLSDFQGAGRDVMGVVTGPGSVESIMGAYPIMAFWLEQR